jgi:ABC-type Fe3+ transport system permease subunit
MSDPHANTKPRGIRAKVAHRREQLEPLVRDFEWTWTKAVLFSLGFVFFIMVTMVIIPSFWTYLVEQKLQWGGQSDIQAFSEEIRHPWNLDTGREIRDAVAMGLTTVPLIAVFIVAAMMQNWRRKLRGGSESRPTGGYR